ncbi:MAG: hypothetical protein HC796_07000 [Synechococcaceae cyanobacterium RL_1_2]|nr:hypothetical protein [Synechococcaceae cyanobacterium RL_1_2]
MVEYPTVSQSCGLLGGWTPWYLVIFQSIATPETRLEILDWYHRKENLHKIGGSRTRLAQVESELWQGQVDTALTLLADCTGERLSCFRQYFERHRHRIINYAYYQAEPICSIGSSAVESAIKQISAHLKLSGAQWEPCNINAMLALRCAYLNRAL